MNGKQNFVISWRSDGYLNRVLVAKAKVLVVLFMVPYLSFSQSHIFQYYNDVQVFQNGEALLNPWTGGFNSSQVNQADIDGDGVEELILMDRHARSVKVFSFSQGNYQFRPELLEYLPPLNIDWVIFADYNCDGKKDIFNYGNGGAILYKNISDDGQYAAWEKVADPVLTTGFTGKINLFVNPTDIPAIQDIDGDGDLDILNYDFATGEVIRYHRNMSVENGADCEDYDFVIVDREWGSFRECSCFEYAFHGQLCPPNSGARVAHVGGKSLTAYDIDGDGDQDIFLGHDDCATLTLLENVGDADTALFVDFTHDFPPESIAAAIEIYPTVQFRDVDFDGVEEMILSPNIDENLSFTSDFARSLWVYQKEGSDYTLQRQNFLQNQMLDFGELSAPVFVDIDRDGDMDLLMAANGHEDEGVFYGRIILLENTGSYFSPEFTVADDDFLHLSTLKLQAPKIRLVDLNGDGRADLFYTGYSPEELATRSFVFADQSSGQSPPDFTGEPILVEVALAIFENPTFFDVDGDGDPDMMVGRRDGSLALFENQGNYTFALKETDYLGIERDFSLNKRNLFVEVTDLNRDGLPDLVTADRRELVVYYNFRSTMEDSTVLRYFDEGTEHEAPIQTENYNWIVFADLFGTTYPAMIIGGSGGGLRLFRSKDEPDNPDEVPLTFKLYPNPVNQSAQLIVETNKPGTAALYNLLGQPIAIRIPIAAGLLNRLNLSPLAQGVYVMVFESPGQRRVVEKVVVR